MKFRVASHTDNVGFGSIYVAVPGAVSNGNSFIVQAIELGAKLIVVERGQFLDGKTKAFCKQKNIKINTVSSARKALSELSAEAYSYPAKKLKIVGVTGTDGKTTSVYLLFNILKKAGKKVALLSGVENILCDDVSQSSMTTPKPDYLNYFFDQCVKKNIEYVVMELSAQATSYNRIAGIALDGIIFTNLSHEHGECYQSIDDYFEAKCLILAQNKINAPLIVNSDSRWAKKICRRFKRTITFGQKCGVDYQAISVQETFARQLCEMRIDKQWYQVDTLLLGSYNVSNIIGVVALAHQLGISIEGICSGVSAHSGVAGRLERYRLPNNAWAVVDYAHTPQAYSSILSMLKQYARNLIVVFGAGGGKDLRKRSQIGIIAANYADQIILTNDNPRNDDPEKIMNDIVADLTARDRLKIHREPDRDKAVNWAFRQSFSGDIIAILGKGHEMTQTINGTVYLHSDVNVVKRVLKTF